MSQIFRVAVHYDNDNGFIEYDASTRQVKVQLADAGKRREAEAFFQSKQILRAAQHTLMDFIEQPGMPTDSLDNFKLALGHLWQATEVHVDWSRPV